MVKKKTDKRITENKDIQGEKRKKLNIETYSFQNVPTPKELVERSENKCERSENA